MASRDEWAAAVEQALEHYRRLGYSVAMEVQLPSGAERFDLVATKDGETVAVEVKPRRPGSEASLSALRDAATTRGWQFHLYIPRRREPPPTLDETVPPPLGVDAAAAAAWESLALARAGLSSESRELRGLALVQACRALEFWFRLEAQAREEVPSSSDWRDSIALLVALGAVPRADYSLFEAALRARDRYIHGWQTDPEWFESDRQLWHLVERAESLIGGGR